MVKTAIILAGGLGTRLREAVPNLPKPMVPIHNRPFLEHQMDYWIEQGITRFILSVGYLKDIIISHFGNSYKSVSIDYAIETSPLGTGGALLLAAKNLNETFLVLNGDTFIEVSLDGFFLACSFIQNILDFHHAVFVRDKTISRYRNPSYCLQNNFNKCVGYNGFCLISYP